MLAAPSHTLAELSEASKATSDLTDIELDQILENHTQSKGIEAETAVANTVNTEPSLTSTTDEERKETGSGSFLPLLSRDELVPLETIELRYIKYVLEKSNGVKDRAAKILKVDRKTLYRKLEAIEQTPSITLN